MLPVTKDMSKPNEVYSGQTRHKAYYAIPALKFCDSVRSLRGEGIGEEKREEAKSEEVEEKEEVQSVVLVGWGTEQLGVTRRQPVQH